MIGETRWLTDVDGREPFSDEAVAAARSRKQQLDQALSIAQRTSAILVDDLHYAQRAANHADIGPAMVAELDAAVAHIHTLNRTLTRLREQTR